MFLTPSLRTTGTYLLYCILRTFWRLESFLLGTISLGNNISQESYLILVQALESGLGLALLMLTPKDELVWHKAYSQAFKLTPAQVR